MLKFAGSARCRTTSSCTASSRCSGEKMSKSRGTGISPERYLELGMNPEWLRYYIAAKLNDKVEDIDFNPDDFVARVNSDLIGKYVNIASRAARFISAVRQQAGAHPQAFEARHRRRRRRRRREAIADAVRRSGVSARRCARSWRSRTRPTSTSTGRSRGIWRGSRTRAARPAKSARSASTISGFSTTLLKPVAPGRLREAPKRS